MMAKWFHRFLIVALVLAAMGRPGFAQEPDSVVVPGGKQAMSVLLGSVRQEDAAFVESVNRVLLTGINQDHRWEQIRVRQDLVGYLLVVAEIRSRFGSRIEIGLEPRETRRSVVQLANTLGYRARVRRGQLEVLPKEGADDAFRRQVAQALGWNLPQVATRVTGSHREVLELHDDLVHSPLPLVQWRAMIGGTSIVSESALLMLARDQRASLVLAGFHRVTPETQELLMQMGLDWLYREAPVAFFRYADSIEVRDGRLVIPGGPEAAPIWARLVGERLDAPDAFIKRLLSHRSGRFAYLWHAMSFAPPQVAGYYLGATDTSASDDHRFVVKLINRLHRSAQSGLDSPRAEEHGFHVLVRSLAVDEETGTLKLPGGAGLWLAAIQDSDLPRNHQAVERAVQRADMRIDDGELLLRSLGSQVDVGGVRRSTLPRLVRSVNSMLDRIDLLDAHNIILVARASDNFPAAFSVLDRFPFESPETIAAYLMAVHHLDGLPDSVDKELVLTIFQGGVEWLTLVAEAEGLPAEDLDGHLLRWSQMHHAATSVGGWTPAHLRLLQMSHLRWLEMFLSSLPAAEPEAPGRAPLEAAWIQALVGSRDPQLFTWAGLDYEGRQGDRLARDLVGHLVTQQIPVVDRVLELATVLDELTVAVAEQEKERIGELSRRAKALVDGLPEIAITDIGRKEEIRSRILPVERPDLSSMLDRLIRQSTGRRAPRMSAELRQFPSLLSRELRPVFLAPAYVTAMADSDAVVLSDPNLVRKHLLTPDVVAGQVRQSPWGRAMVVPAQEDVGVHVVGHVSRVRFALAEFTFPLFQGGRRDLLERDRAWVDDFLSTPWHALSPQLTGLVAALEAAGADLATSALTALEAGAETPVLDFVRARVPPARLSRSLAKPGVEPGPSPGERLLLGLAALAGDSRGPAQPTLLAEDHRRSLEQATAAVGPNWRQRLHLVGAATPAMDGRGRRWVGDWPPFEALDKQRFDYALWERQLLDLRVAVLATVGQFGLPGEVARDVMQRVLLDLHRDLSPDSPSDWLSFLLWVETLDDGYLEEKVRECLHSGLYSLQEF